MALSLCNEFLTAQPERQYCFCVYDSNSGLTGWCRLSTVAAEGLRMECKPTASWTINVERAQVVDGHVLTRCVNGGGLANFVYFIPCRD